MATYRKRDDPLVSCPYNPAHRMLQSRLQLHITKCQKYHLDAELKTCPFNAKHRINAAEFSHHLVSCPDKAIVELKIASERSEYSGNTQVPSYASAVPLPAETDYWDDESTDTAVTYEERSSKPLYKDMIKIQDMQPAERRNYYRSLCRGETEDENGGASSQTASEQPVPQNQQFVLKALRQPRSNPEDASDFQLRRQAMRNRPHVAPAPPPELGRGHSTRRIAANLYGLSNSEAALYPTNDFTNGLAGLNLGRGRGVLGATFREAPVPVDDYPPVPHGQVTKIL